VLSHGDTAFRQCPQPAQLERAQPEQLEPEPPESPDDPERPPIAKVEKRRSVRLQRHLGHGGAELSPMRRSSSKPCSQRRQVNS
jgi:hypothetical protein